MSLAVSLQEDDEMIDDKKFNMPIGVAATTLDVLNPTRSVIIDMIMVQFLASILTMSLVLVFKGDEMGSTNASYLLVGLFTSLLLLSGIFARITRGV